MIYDSAEEATATGWPPNPFAVGDTAVWNEVDPLSRTLLAEYKAKLGPGPFIVTDKRWRKGCPGQVEVAGDWFGHMWFRKVSAT